MRVSAEIRRVTSSTDDISSEKTATGFLKSTAILRAIVSARAVLPIPGRAAIINKVPFCQPLVMLSKSGKPEGRPLMPPSTFEMASTSLIASFTSSFMSV